MNSFFLPPPELAVRATMDKGFVAFFDRRGQCLGRRDTEYMEQNVVDFVASQAKERGTWVHTLYLNLIWKPLARLGDNGYLETI